jgi:hypothetical protein
MGKAFWEGFFTVIWAGSIRRGDGDNSSSAGGSCCRRTTVSVFGLRRQQTTLAADGRQLVGMMSSQPTSQPSTSRHSVPRQSVCESTLGWLAHFCVGAADPSSKGKAALRQHQIPFPPSFFGCCCHAPLLLLLLASSGPQIALRNEKRQIPAISHQRRKERCRRRRKRKNGRNEAALFPLLQ